MQKRWTKIFSRRDWGTRAHIRTSASLVNLATSKNVSTEPKYSQHTYASPDGNNNKHINHILVLDDST